MEKKRELAIVLRATPFEDRHKIVCALTLESGRISGMARNAVQSRRFGGTLDLFAASEWEYSLRPGADLVNIERAEIKRSFANIRGDFERLACASFCCEFLLRGLPERQPNPEVFRVLSNALALLDAEGGAKNWLPLLDAYLIKMLSVLGVEPQFKECRSCGKQLISWLRENHSQRLRCSVSDGAWTCMGCVQSASRESVSFADRYIDVAARALGTSHRWLSEPIRRSVEIAEEDGAPTEDEQRELFAFLWALTVFHIPGFDREPVKSLSFLGLDPRSNRRPTPASPSRHQPDPT